MSKGEISLEMVVVESNFHVLEKILSLTFLASTKVWRRKFWSRAGEKV